ncbi:MAG: hypothetical protein N4A35_05290 [Flavobacteriales bacterium]|jgi:hypothetical protein|nr:hypothetical protein [Flavobacteriales bacterium]
MKSISTPTIEKMIAVIKTILEQSKDNPEMVKSIFGFAIVQSCNEIEEELKTK